MWNIKILTIGKNKENWLQEGINLYHQRLCQYVHLHWIFTKSEKQLVEMAKKEKKIICLDVKGKPLSSEDFSTYVFDKVQTITFIIGGDKGLPIEIFSLTDEIWSISKLTFTHQMVRLILVEQIYRGLMIYQQHPYHK